MEQAHCPSNFELAIIRKLLGIDFPERNQLVLQLDGLMVQKIDDEGSLDLIVSSSPSLQISNSKEWMTPVVKAEYFDNNEATGLSDPNVHILLYAMNGFLRELEFYKDDGSKILRMPAPEELEPIVFHR
jgi:hypothetical protein